MEIDLGTVAKRVVDDCLRIKKKDSLGVHVTEHMLPMAKEIVKAARRAGADTEIVVDSDDVWYEALFELPLEWLRAPSALAQAFRKASTANVYIEGPKDPDRMREIPAERWAANDKGATATYAPFENKPVPSIDLSISRVTEERARTYGFDYGEWYSSSMAAMAVDPKEIGKSAAPIARALARARKGRITAPGGTDFEFRFHGAAPEVSTGEVRPVKGRKSSYLATLPDGEVRVALRKGSGEGRIVSNVPIPQAGHLIRGLRWNFEGGRVAKAEAAEHLEAFTMFLTGEKRRKGADQLGWLNVGLNPAAKYGFLQNSIVEGAITIGIGDNTTYGGTNESEFVFPITLKDASLEVDGKRLVAGGKLTA